MSETEKFAVASVKAFIEKDGKILILRESPKYKGGSQHGCFVMPGGKVNEGEPFSQSIKRELKEECNIEVEVGKIFHVEEWFIDVPGKPKHIVGMYFICHHTGGDLNICDEFDLYEWINPKEYQKYNINIQAQKAFEAYNEIIN